MQILDTYLSILNNPNATQQEIQQQIQQVQTFLLKKEKYGTDNKSQGFTFFKDESYDFIEYIHNTYGYSHSLFDISKYNK